MRGYLALLLITLCARAAGADAVALASLADAVPARDATGRRAAAMDGRLRAALAARAVSVRADAPVRLSGRILAAHVENATDTVPFVNVWKPVHLAFAKVEMAAVDRATGRRLAGGVFAEEARRDRSSSRSGADFGPDFGGSALGVAADAAFGRAVETLCREAGVAFTPVAAAPPASVPAAVTDRLLFADDFSGGRLDPRWRAGQPGQWSTVGGALRVSWTGGVPTLSAGGDPWGDVAVEWRMRRLGGSTGLGHAGMYLRRSENDQLYLFVRPGGLRFAGFGRTESPVSPRPLALRDGEWHHFRVELRGDSATINVDGQAYGSVGGIANRAGAIAFAAFQENAEFDDLRITALAPEAHATPAGPAPPPPSRAIPLLVLDPHADAQPDRLVTITAAAAGLRIGTALPSVMVTGGPGVGKQRAAGSPTPPLSHSPTPTLSHSSALPAQFDDLDGDGRVSPDDEIAFRADLPAGGVRRLILRVGPAAASVPAAHRPEWRVEGDLNGPYVVAGRRYRVAGDTATAAFSVEFPAGGVRLFTLRPWKDEKVVGAASGPARVVLCSQVAVANNGRARRVISLDGESVAIRHTLSSADGKQSAFVQNTEAIWLNAAPEAAITGTRWRDWRGSLEERTGGAQFQHIFIHGAGAPAQDLLLENGTAVALIRQGAPDYGPGLGLVSGHAYASGSLAFGWRPPVEVRPGTPHRNDLILFPHLPEREAFVRADRRFTRDPVVLAGPQAARVHAAALRRTLSHLLAFQRSGLAAPKPPAAPIRPAQTVRLRRVSARPAAQPVRLSRVSARLAAQPVRLRPAPSRAADGSSAFTIARAVAGLDAAGRDAARLPRALASATAALARLDLVGRCDLAIRALSRREQALAAAADRHGVETAPVRGLLLQAHTLVTAARMDFAVERHARGAGRLSQAAALVGRARGLAGAGALYARLLPGGKPGPVVPYVTFSEGADDRMLALGFDVAHFWFPWGAHFDWDVFEPEPGRYRFEVADAAWRAVAKPGVRLIPLLNLAPPKWYVDRYGAELDSLADPKMLGEEPEHLRAFGSYIRALVRRYGRSPQVLAWAVRNEPAYYSMGGATTPALLRAMRRYLGGHYRDVAALNAVWGTSFTSFDAVDSPRSFADNRAAWYDVMIWKAKCLAGELAWEADVATADALCKRTGAKYVPACFGPQAARSGYGVDPWLSSPPQRGVAMCDLYLDGEQANALRASEQFWGCGGVPVISPETGRASRDPNEVYRWHYWPPRRAMSFAWTLFQHGLFGTHYWTWAGGEEYSAVDWDGTVGDFAVWAARMNRLFQAAGPALSRARPRADVGLFYPRATFIQGEATHVATYERLYALLQSMGYQPRLLSETDFARAAPGLRAIAVPDAPYLERSLLPAFRRYVAAGGTLLFAGVPALFDEHARPYGKEGQTGLEELLGTSVGAALRDARGRVLLQGTAAPVAFANHPPWRVLRPAAGTRAVGKSPSGAALVTERRSGRGRAILVPAPLGSAFGAGVPVAELAGPWRFRLGDSWPQAAGTGQTTTEGHADRGRAGHWERPGIDDSGWDTVPVPGVWEESGYAGKDGWGWYRKRFALPKELAGRRVLLVGDTLDDRAEVYVNGARVLTTMTWDQRFSVDVTAQVRPGAANVIALRIEDTCFLGGVRGSISLVSPDLPVPDARLLAALLGRAGVRPSAALASGGEVFRAVLEGPDGAYLAASNSDAFHAAAVTFAVPAGKGEPGARLAAAGRGRVLNVFTGEPGAFAREGSLVRVTLRLEPLGVALVPLRPLRPAPPAGRKAALAALAPIW